MKQNPLLQSQRKAKSYDSKEREKDWEADVVGSLRETFLAQTLSLSEEWKKEKAAKEEQKKRDQERAAEQDRAEKAANEVEVVAESDDEIIIGEVVKKAHLSKRDTGKGKQSVADDKDKPTRSNALRLR